MGEFLDFFKSKKNISSVLILGILILVLPLLKSSLEKQKIIQSRATEDPIVFVAGDGVSQREDGTWVSTKTTVPLKLTSPLGDVAAPLTQVSNTILTSPLNISLVKEAYAASCISNPNIDAPGNTKWVGKCSDTTSCYKGEGDHSGCVKYKVTNDPNHITPDTSYQCYGFGSGNTSDFRCIQLEYVPPKIDPTKGKCVEGEDPTGVNLYDGAFKYKAHCGMVCSNNDDCASLRNSWGGAFTPKDTAWCWGYGNDVNRCLGIVPRDDPKGNIECKGLTDCEADQFGSNNLATVTLRTSWSQWGACNDSGVNSPGFNDCRWTGAELCVQGDNESAYHIVAGWDWKQSSSREDDIPWIQKGRSYKFGLFETASNCTTNECNTTQGIARACKGRLIKEIRVDATSPLPAAQNLKAECSAGSVVTITWNSISGATAYTMRTNAFPNGQDNGWSPEGLGVYSGTTLIAPAVSSTTTGDFAVDTRGNTSTTIKAKVIPEMRYNTSIQGQRQGEKYPYKGAYVGKDFTCSSQVPTAAPTVAPTAVPTVDPTAAPTVAPTAAPVITVSYRIAESPTGFTNTVNDSNDPHGWKTYTAEGMTINYDFKTPGQKSIFVEFKDSTGKTERHTAQIKILGPDPVVTSCALSFEGDNALLTLIGQGFGVTKGGAKSDDKDLQIKQWKNDSVMVIWPNAPTNQALAVTLTNTDGQSGSGTCSSISQIALGAKVFCRAPSNHQTDNVDLVLVDTTEGGKKIKQKVKIDKDGTVIGLTQKLETGKTYTLSLKAPKSLRRSISFTAGAGTNEFSNFVLPVGDIFPADGGDGAINALDKSALNRQWNIAGDAANRSGDFNLDGKINSIDWACMRYDFGQKDDPEPVPGPEGIACGGIAGITCPTGYACKLSSNFPDASGRCVLTQVCSTGDTNCSGADSGIGLEFLTPEQDPSIPPEATSGRPGDAIAVGTISSIGSGPANFTFIGNPIQSTAGFTWASPSGTAAGMTVAVLVALTVSPGTYTGTGVVKNNDNDKQLTFPVTVRVIAP